jgi:biotin-(acetyl-CoA carboxylase) ligase
MSLVSEPSSPFPLLSTASATTAHFPVALSPPQTMAEPETAITCARAAQFRSRRGLPQKQRRRRRGKRRGKQGRAIAMCLHNTHNNQKSQKGVAEKKKAERTLMRRLLQTASHVRPGQAEALIPAPRIAFLSFSELDSKVLGGQAAAGAQGEHGVQAFDAWVVRGVPGLREARERLISSVAREAESIRTRQKGEVYSWKERREVPGEGVSQESGVGSHGAAAASAADPASSLSPASALDRLLLRVGILFLRFLTDASPSGRLPGLASLAESHESTHRSATTVSVLRGGDSGALVESLLSGKAADEVFSEPETRVDPPLGMLRLGVTSSLNPGGASEQEAAGAAAPLGPDDVLIHPGGALALLGGGEIACSALSAPRHSGSGDLLVEHELEICPPQDRAIAGDADASEATISYLLRDCVQQAEWHAGQTWADFSPREAVWQELAAHKDDAGFQVADLSVRTFARGPSHVTLIHMPLVRSTHALALAWNRDLVGSDSFVVFVADAQNAGVGQRSNLWSSPPGNLYITFLFRRPKVSVELQFFPSLCVLRAVEKFLSDRELPTSGVELKWVNDIFLEDKKLGGVLLAAEQGNDAVITMSAGVNLNLAPLETAMCLRDAVGGEVDVGEWAQSLTETVVDLVDVDGPDIIAEVRSRLRFLNEHVVIRSEDLSTVLHEGVFVGIDNFGFAQLRMPDGTVQRIMEGRMRKA